MNRLPIFRKILKICFCRFKELNAYSSNIYIFTLMVPKLILT